MFYATIFLIDSGLRFTHWSLTRLYASRCISAQHSSAVFPIEGNCFNCRRLCTYIRSGQLCSNHIDQTNVDSQWPSKVPMPAPCAQQSFFVWQYGCRAEGPVREAMLKNLIDLDLTLFSLPLVVAGRGKLKNTYKLACITERLQDVTSWLGAES